MNNEDEALRQIFFLFFKCIKWKILWKLGTCRLHVAGQQGWEMKENTIVWLAPSSQGFLWQVLWLGSLSAQPNSTSSPWLVREPDVRQDWPLWSQCCIELAGYRAKNLLPRPSRLSIQAWLKHSTQKGQNLVTNTAHLSKRASFNATHCPQ